ncbi:hypothetical protein MKX03_029448 [Papaver bracteatum]|nr:hypothetical protein MKX03_029448 [Papaver bracteatum]
MLLRAASKAMNVLQNGNDSWMMSELKEIRCTKVSSSIFLTYAANCWISISMATEFWVTGYKSSFWHDIWQRDKFLACYLTSLLLLTHKEAFIADHVDVAAEYSLI